MHGAGDAAAPHRIHQNRRVGPVEQREQLPRRCFAGMDAGSGRQRSSGQALGHGETGGIVPSTRAYADDADPHGGSRRSISRLRKWVAHEMQGS